MTLGSLLLIALTAASSGVPQSSATDVVDRSATVSVGAEPAVQAGMQKNADIIMPHITDARYIEIPWFSASLHKAIDLPRWAPLQIGPLVVDLSPTKHVVMMLFAATLCALTLILAAQSHRRHSHARGYPRGFSTGVEATVLFIRDEVIKKNVGHHGDGFVPYLLTVFFFILFANLLGLIPYGATATGNISVTATLAVMSFIAIEIAGMRALGSGYWGTIFYWPKDEPFGVMKVALFLILTPIEFLGKFTKPFALAIRLFANMTAGHVIVLAFIGMIFTFGNIFVAIAPLAMAIGIMLLEVLVAFIQAYIFTLLTSVFIGQIREAHH